MLMLFIKLRVAVNSIALPPAGDGVDGKGCRLMRDVDEHRVSEKCFRRSACQSEILKVQSKPLSLSL